MPEHPINAVDDLILKHTFPGSCERVFAMWTTGELLKKWFCPGDDMTVPVAEVDARDGGSYRIVMQNQNGETYSSSGVYEQVVPNEKLVFSWQWADSEVVTRVTIDFRALDDDATELTLTHEGFPNTEMCDRHNEGWKGCLSRLSNVLQSQEKEKIQ